MQLDPMKAHLESSRPHALTLIVIMGFLRMLLHSVRPRPEIQQTYVIYRKTSALFITLRAKLSGTVYCYRSCLWLVFATGGLAGGRCLSVTTITWKCMHRSSPN